MCRAIRYFGSTKRELRVTEVGVIESQNIAVNEVWREHLKFCVAQERLTNSFLTNTKSYQFSKIPQLLSSELNGVNSFLFQF